LDSRKKVCRKKQQKAQSRWAASMRVDRRSDHLMHNSLRSRLGANWSNGSNLVTGAQDLQAGCQGGDSWSSELATSPSCSGGGSGASTLVK
jgi:hypothetical protein